jgi:hypothetical protein
MILQHQIFLQQKTEWFAATLVCKLSCVVNEPVNKPARNTACCHIAQTIETKNLFSCTDKWLSIAKQMEQITPLGNGFNVKSLQVNFATRHRMENSRIKKTQQRALTSVI